MGTASDPATAVATATATLLAAWGQQPPAVRAGIAPELRAQLADLATQLAHPQGGVLGGAPPPEDPAGARKSQARALAPPDTF